MEYTLSEYYKEGEASIWVVGKFSGSGSKLLIWQAEHIDIVGGRYVRTARGDEFASAVSDFNARYLLGCTQSDDIRTWIEELFDNERYFAIGEMWIYFLSKYEPAVRNNLESYYILSRERTQTLAMDLAGKWASDNGASSCVGKFGVSFEECCELHGVVDFPIKHLVKLGFDKDIPMVSMPDGSTGYICIGRCKGFFSYVSPNRDNGYMCPTCRQ